MRSSHARPPAGARPQRRGSRRSTLLVGIAVLLSACSAAVPRTQAPTAPTVSAASFRACRWCRTAATTTAPTTSPTTTTAPRVTTTTVAPAPPPQPGARDVRLWPFAATSVWNLPLGDQATFDGRVITTAAEINSVNGFGVSVGSAGYALVDQSTANAYAESHYSFVNADGVTATEWYQYQFPSNPNRNNIVTDLRAGGIWGNGITNGPVGSVHQVRASRVSQLGGLIRSYDLSSGAIRHALSWALPNSALRAGWVWPAAGQDGDAATAYGGFVPMGALVAIPRGVPMPAGMSAAGQMIWQALQTYGAYVVDRGASAPFYAEGAASAAVNPARADLPRIVSQLRLVTNASAANVGGPGNRLAPLAPPV
ncbi:MAG TPA: hypothetical protein VFC99_00910 [Acidimicrobiia bacterium]|nr:hypothetical protein [Acidimicrobiia bacterium]